MTSARAALTTPAYLWVITRVVSLSRRRKSPGWINLDAQPCSAHKKASVCAFILIKDGGSDFGQIRWRWLFGSTPPSSWPYPLVNRQRYGTRLCLHHKCTGIMLPRIFPWLNGTAVLLGRLHSRNACHVWSVATSNQQQEPSLGEYLHFFPCSLLFICYFLFVLILYQFSHLCWK